MGFLERPWSLDTLLCQDGIWLEDLCAQLAYEGYGINNLGMHLMN